MNVSLLALSAPTYQRHAIHSTERIWTETNCYVDVWIELLHSLGHDPLTAAAFALSSDFEGDQWTFFKYPSEDLYRAYGIDVHEMNPWRGTLAHVVEQLALGRLLTVEANSYYLPDTAGVAYGLADVKSTIVPNSVDVEHRRLGYFHNAGYFELEGDDFDGVFGLGEHRNPSALPPYVELVRLDRRGGGSEGDDVEVAHELLTHHLRMRPDDNPVRRMAERIHADIGWVRQEDPETFHAWAFATVRQCGASAELAADFCRWLGTRSGDDPTLLTAADHWRSLAQSAKALQFLMARVARGRDVNLTETLDSMAADWELAQAHSALPVM